MIHLPTTDIRWEDAYDPVTLEFHPEYQNFPTQDAINDSRDWTEKLEWMRAYRATLFAKNILVKNRSTPLSRSINKRIKRYSSRATRHARDVDLTGDVEFSVKSDKGSSKRPRFRAAISGKDVSVSSDDVLPRSDPKGTSDSSRRKGKRFLIACFNGARPIILPGSTLPTELQQAKLKQGLANTLQAIADKARVVADQAQVAATKAQKEANLAWAMVKGK
jgi:hypothetical protein